MRLTFLGTGTSFGVPQIGCECAVCRSADPRDRRNRSGALVEAGGSVILIDTPPELRLQLIASGVTQVDAVMYTHEHADHINGIDDLRVFSVKQRRPLPLYGPAETLQTLRSSFSYIFDDNVRPYEGTSKPTLELRPLARWFIVTRTLKAGAFTRKGRAPRIFHPSATHPPAPEVLTRLTKAVIGMEGDIRSGHPEGRHTVAHPFFGTLPTTDYLRLQAIHTRHHRSQLT